MMRRALSMVELVTTLALVSLLALVGFFAVRPVLDRGDVEAARVRLATATLEARRATVAGAFPADVTTLTVPGITFAVDVASDDKVGAVVRPPGSIAMVTRAGQGCLAVVYAVGSPARWGQWQQSETCSASAAWGLEGQILGSADVPSALS